MAMSMEVAALAVAAAALWMALLAFHNARLARLLALQAVVRRDLDTALADAQRLTEKGDRLADETLQAASAMRGADGSVDRPDERAAIDLREEARRPVADLRQVGPDLGRMSRGKLEALRSEIARARRSIDDIDTRLDMKRAALDRLLDEVRRTGGQRDAVLLLKPLGFEARPAKPGA